MIMIVPLCIVPAIAQPRAFGVPNLMIILHDMAVHMVPGKAMTIVITARGIDLSIGAVAALSAIVMAMLIKDVGANVYVVMVAAVAVGLVRGFVNSVIITRIRVADLLAMLAMDRGHRGIALVPRWPSATPAWPPSNAEQRAFLTVADGQGTLTRPSLRPA